MRGMLAGMQKGNLFGEIPRALAEEQFAQLFAAGGVRIERILSRGQRSPGNGWYDQAEDEWVALLQGSARIEFEDAAGDKSEVALGAGDWLLIPARQRHRVTFTSTEPACVWLAVHVGHSQRP